MSFDLPAHAHVGCGSASRVRSACHRKPPGRLVRASDYDVLPNVTYVTAGNTEVKLDIYRRRGVTTPQPTVIHFDGGFWAAGTKEAGQCTSAMA